MPLKINSPSGGSITLDVPSTLTTANTLTLPFILDNSAYLLSGSSAQINTGFTVLAYNAGSNVAAYGTWTPNAANGNYQYANSNGAVTIAAPATDCAMDILFENGVNAKTVTFSGYTVQTGGTGDLYATTSTSKFILTVVRIRGVSTYVWKALQ